MSSNDFRYAIITASDKASQKQREDESGLLIQKIMQQRGFQLKHYSILPDEMELLSDKMRQLADSGKVDLILTTGGTGLSPRDFTPEATLAVAHRNVPGIAEAMRNHSMQYTKRAMLSRGVSVVRANTLIINLPGSPKAVRENLEFLVTELGHALEILTARAGECAR